jgi:hypothetical protein
MRAAAVRVGKTSQGYGRVSRALRFSTNALRPASALWRILSHGDLPVNVSRPALPSRVRCTLAIFLPRTDVFITLTVPCLA